MQFFHELTPLLFFNFPKVVLSFPPFSHPLHYYPPSLLWNGCTVSSGNRILQQHSVPLHSEPLQLIAASAECRKLFSFCSSEMNDNPKISQIISTNCSWSYVQVLNHFLMTHARNRNRNKLLNHAHFTEMQCKFLVK